MYEGAVPCGPLAGFEGADTWIEHPYVPGVVLIGHAAASNDPSFGQGLSLTLRDVRSLRDHLLREEDWHIACHAYAEEHDRYYGALHTATQWFAQMFYQASPEADAIRVRAFPLFQGDPSRVIDHLFSGPDLPLDDAVKRRFFGEE